MGCLIFSLIASRLLRIFCRRKQSISPKFAFISLSHLNIVVWPSQLGLVKIYKSRYVIEFVQEQSEKGAKTVPTYIKDIQDEFFIDGEDDEEVHVDRGRHSASTSADGRQVVSANLNLSTTNKLQVSPNSHIIPNYSQFGDHIGRQPNTNAGHGRNFLSNYPPSTKPLEPSKRIVFPKDDVDKNRRNYRKERTSSKGGKNYLNPTINRNYSDLVNFDDWVPLTGLNSESRVLLTFWKYHQSK